MNRVVLACATAAIALVPAASASAEQVRAGAAVVDGTYHVGNSAGQYSSTRDEGYGSVDPHLQQVKNQASYGVQARESVRALVVEGNGGLIALIHTDHYIPQDAVLRRTAQLLEADPTLGGKFGMHNLTMSTTHNHSSPSYSSIDWGVWLFQDVFDFRFFDFYARQMAKAVKLAYEDLQAARVSGTVSHFDKFHKNPMGPRWADDGAPVGFPRPYTDHDLVVVRFEGLGGEPIGTFVNIGQHPEDLEGYDLISGEYPAIAERYVDRSVGGVSIFTQNATGTSEVEEDRWHPISDRALFNHAQYQQMEWAGRLLGDAVIANVEDIQAQQPNGGTPKWYPGTPYAERFVPWQTDFEVGIEDRWFGGPVSHPYPGVSNCRTDATLAGDVNVPLAGGPPDCQRLPGSAIVNPIVDMAGTNALTTDDFQALGIPVPENYSAPSYGGLQDTLGVHMQAIRLGDILFTVCSCEQWADQAFNIKTRADKVAGNEHLGYDPTGPYADKERNYCEPNADGATWRCTIKEDPHGTQSRDIPNRTIELMRARIRNDATGWDDPTCQELGCGFMAESEPTDLSKIRGNFTHDDNQRSADYGYKLVATIAMANDYNGYIPDYRDYNSYDHYRKSLAGFGSHSMDYYATRLVRMGRALNGDDQAKAALDGETDLTKAKPEWAAIAAKEVADQIVEDVRVRAVGEAASAGVIAYDQTVPDDGEGGPDDTVQPKDIERFDAATFTWVGGNNYTDNPYVTVERRVDGEWKPFADQSGEVPMTVAYPAGYAGFDEGTPAAVGDGVAAYRAGGQVWKWTATFEAFVSWFPLIDPEGQTYEATPPGEYRFVVDGLWRRGRANVEYRRESEPFTVSRWSGITVENASVGSDGRVRFSAGPTHTITEGKVRRSARPDYGPLTFEIGPVDFPDTAQDQAASGTRFLNDVRGYSGDQPTNQFEHYCLDCSFRPWLDATGDLTAKVVIARKGRKRTEDTLTPDASGGFVSRSALRRGEQATITITDAWGNYNGAPAVVSR